MRVTIARFDRAVQCVAGIVKRQPLAESITQFTQGVPGSRQPQAALKVMMVVRQRQGVVLLAEQRVQFLLRVMVFDLFAQHVIDQRQQRALGKGRVVVNQ